MPERSLSDSLLYTHGGKVRIFGLKFQKTFLIKFLAIAGNFQQIWFYYLTFWLAKWAYYWWKSNLILYVSSVSVPPQILKVFIYKQFIFLLQPVLLSKYQTKWQDHSFLRWRSELCDWRGRHGGIPDYRRYFWWVLSFCLSPLFGGVLVILAVQQLYCWYYLILPLMGRSGTRIWVGQSHWSRWGRYSGYKR